MLFNSLVFLLLFLPASLAVHAAVATFQPRWRLAVLFLMSLVFYGYWDWRFLPLMLASIALNWVAAEVFVRNGRGAVITAAIVLNLIVLAIFKYFNFFAGIATLIPGVLIPRSELALPLGISFFTFHHVMYLVDLRRGLAPRLDPVRYGLYIAFYPQVLAGPLVRWREIVHQFDESPYARPDAMERIGRGLILLALGLAKKVFLGDPLGEIANPVFQAASLGQPIGIGQAWAGTIAFTLQIYFDFSGYTDMALGIALMFGIVLPQNFDVPYRATSLQDFWRRWHMTLSRFLRDYLYIPLGGSRNGVPIQIWALFATMTLGGLWHGAGWTYVVWGMLHGAVLGIGVLWRRAGLPMPALLGWLLTFGFVALTFVMFRAETFSAALHLYEALIGLGDPSWSFRGRNTILIAAAVALIGPTAWAVAHRLKPSPWLAMAVGLGFALLLMRINGSQQYEFIYFQF